MDTIVDYQPSIDLPARVGASSKATGLTQPLPRTPHHPEKMCTCPGCSNQLYPSSTHEQAAYGLSRGTRLQFLRLRPHDHEPVFLALSVIRGFQRGVEGPTKEQIDASREWKQLWPELRQSLRGERRSTASLRLLARSCRLLNEIFFCNKLERMDIVWDPRSGSMDQASPQATSRTSNWIGRTNPGRMGKVNRHTRVTLKPDLHSKLMIGTLLHEMVHALLQQYACTKSDCSCRVLYDENDGDHGRAILWLATAIQDSSNAFLGFTASLHSHRDIGNVIQRSGVHPSLHDINVCLPGRRCLRSEMGPRHVARAGEINKGQHRHGSCSSHAIDYKPSEMLDEQDVDSDVKSWCVLQ